MTAAPLPAWEGATEAELARAWDAPAAHLYSRVDSTSDEARRIASAGAPDGTVVLADRQLAGRGRAGRRWESPAGLGLWFSVVARPPTAAAPGLLPLRVGLAVAEALDPFAAPYTVGVKWPNDLQVAGRKLGGVLCEAVWEGDGLSYVVVGVGINVLHGPADFADSLRGAAVSLRLAAGVPPTRRAVADAVVPAVIRATRAPLDPAAGPTDVLGPRDVLRGLRVRLSDPRTGDVLAVGTAAGIDPDGSLRIEDPGGDVRSFHTGTVRPIEGGEA